MRFSIAVTALAAGLLLAGCAAPEPTPTASPTTSPSPTVSPDASPAAAYCVEKGGTVQSRQATYGTNNDEASWVPFGDPVDVCRFQTLGDADDSRIYVDLVTLYSENPTLAALAYLAKTPIPDDAQGNPATALCTAIGGAINYGTGANGGGLVNKDDPIDVVFAPCVFADGSFIEEWGIAYYADGTVRGIDLADVFRFDPSTAPALTF
jgi:putative hemolysin